MEALWPGSVYGGSPVEEPGLFGTTGMALEAFEQAGALIAALEGPEFVVVAMNEQLRQALGGQPVLGRTWGELVPEMALAPWPERMLEVYTTGRALSGLEQKARFFLPGGTPAERYINVALAPRRDDKGRVKGVIAVGVDVTASAQARRSAEAAIARLNARYQEAREVVVALQQALSLSEVPVVPGLQVAARYLLAADDQSAGGDWYDAVTSPDGCLTLVVGDVVGHGVPASAAMGQLRALLLDRIESGMEPGQALESLERWAHLHPGARSATVCVLRLDPSNGGMRYCTAGHPPPLVVPLAAGEPRYLPPTGAGPLGAGSHYSSLGEVLQHDEVLVLYSDGIIERPAREAPRSTVELGQAATDAARRHSPLGEGPEVTVDRVCEQTIQVLTQPTGQRDDITMMAVQRVSAFAPLRLHLPATPHAVAESRQALARWLAPAAADPSDLNALAQAVTELVTNVVEHAYPQAQPGPMDLEARLEPAGTVSLSVSDQGRWRPSTPRPGRGLGLELLRQLLDGVDVQAADGGTQVTVRTALHRPAGPLSVDTLPAVARPGTMTLQLTAGDAGACLAVTGPVDGTNVHRLEAELARLSRPGEASLVVDLSGVTLLASAAVHALYQALSRAVTGSATIRLYAPSGSTPQHILALSGLPHSTVPT